MKKLVKAILICLLIVSAGFLGVIWWAFVRSFPPTISQTIQSAVVTDVKSERQYTVNTNAANAIVCAISLQGSWHPVIVIYISGDLVLVLNGRTNVDIYKSGMVTVWDKSEGHECHSQPLVDLLIWILHAGSKLP